MLWYSDGTIEIGPDAQVAIGTGTTFLKNVRVGDGLTITGSSSIHEVINIASDSQLSFAPPYAGVRANGLSYRIAPIQGYVKEAADRLREITQRFGEQASSANLASLVGVQGGAGKGLRFKAPGTLEAFQIGSASDRDVTTSALDATPGRLMKVGDFGAGGTAVPYAGPLSSIRQSCLIYANGAADGPEGQFYGWVRHSEITPGEYSYQVAFDVNGRYWTRGLNGAVWGAWDRALTVKQINPAAVIKGYGRGSGSVPGNGAVFPDVNSDPGMGAMPYIGALEIRESGRNVNAFGPAEWVRPAISFHFGGYTVKRLSLDHNGQLWLGADRIAMVSADFERGANANGEYVKFPDGTIIIWAAKTIVPTTASGTSEDFFILPATISLGFPTSVTLSGFNPHQTNSYQIFHDRIVVTGENQVRLQYRTDSIQPFGITYTLLGRWK